MLLSSHIAPGTVSTNDYNHYFLLHSIQDLFGLARFAPANRPGVAGFGNDVFGGAPAHLTTSSPEEIAAEVWLSRCPVAGSSTSASFKSR